MANGLTKDAADGGEEVAGLAVVDLAATGQWVQAGVPERLIHVDVAQAGDQRLVEQGGLEGAAGSTKAGFAGAAERFRVGQGVRAEGGPAACAEVVEGGVRPERTEAAGVAETEREGVRVIGRGGEGPFNVNVVGRGVRIEGQAARHAQLDDEDAAAVGDEGELFSVSEEGGEGGAVEEVGAGRGLSGGAATLAGGVDDVGAADADGSDGAAQEARHEGEADGFDFGKFRHGGFAVVEAGGNL